MAGKKKGKRKSSAKRTGKTIANHKFGGKEFRCYGKTVKVKGGHKAARIFCARNKKK